MSTNAKQIQYNCKKTYFFLYNHEIVQQQLGQKQWIILIIFTSKKNCDENKKIDKTYFVCGNFYTISFMDLN